MLSGVSEFRKGDFAYFTFPAVFLRPCHRLILGRGFLTTKEKLSVYLSNSLRVTCLHQRFLAIFTNSFEPQSLNYDPEFFYAQKNLFICISLEFFTIVPRKRCCVFGPRVGNYLFYQ